MWGASKACSRQTCNPGPATGRTPSGPRTYRRRAIMRAPRRAPPRPTGRAPPTLHAQQPLLCDRYAQPKPHNVGMPTGGRPCARKPRHRASTHMRACPLLVRAVLRRGVRTSGLFRVRGARCCAEHRSHLAGSQAPTLVVSGGPRQHDEANSTHGSATFSGGCRPICDHVAAELGSNLAEVVQEWPTCGKCCKLVHGMEMWALRVQLVLLATKRLHLGEC